MRMHRSRLTVLSCMFFVAVGAVVLGPAASVSANSKVVSGTGCFDWDSQGDQLYSYNRQNGYINNSGSERTVVCPIVKDELGSPVRVYVRTSNLPGQVVDPSKCVVWRRTGGGVLSIFPHSNTTNYPDGTRDVNWNTAIASPAGSHFTVSCELPNGTVLYQYQWAEP